jgi:hypothetical protein
LALMVLMVLICFLTLVLATALDETHENITYVASSMGLMNDTHNDSLNGTFAGSTNGNFEGSVVPENDTFADWWKILLSASALVLSVVNGLILLWSYLRDRPILGVSLVEPDTQWFFALPDDTYQGQPTRNHGLLTYIKVVNRGRRDVSLDSWYLHIKSVGYFI